MRRSTFADAAIETGSAALNRVFENYLVPVNFTPEHLDLHVRYNDVDTAFSPLWYDEAGNVAAAALVGVRGSRAWIGGFGVALEHRQHGYARQLLAHILESARERGLSSVALEVLRENAPAIALYRSSGFESVRELHSFQLAAGEETAPEGYADDAPESYVDRPDPIRPCWQRERSTMRNGAVSGAVCAGSGSYALYRAGEQIAQVLKLAAADAQDLGRLGRAVAAARGVANVLLLNEPRESPVTGYAETAGWSRPFEQFEMMKNL